MNAKKYRTAAVAVEADAGLVPGEIIEPRVLGWQAFGGAVSINLQWELPAGKSYQQQQLYADGSWNDAGSPVTPPNDLPLFESYPVPMNGNTGIRYIVV